MEAVRGISKYCCHGARRNIVCNSLEILLESTIKIQSEIMQEQGIDTLSSQLRLSVSTRLLMLS
ncbi:hypothetical protein J6590_105582 [Homalodisca vitripennis]|nr:hypothetical protein J6590_105582 [Homalodisca vitripennis]